MKQDIIKFNSGIDIYNDFNKTKHILENITFDIENVQDFKKTIANCNKTVKEITAIRIEYKKYWLDKIEDDLKLLSTMENELKYLIQTNNTTYENYLEDLIFEKKKEIESYFKIIIDDYPFKINFQIVLNNLPNNWQNLTYKTSKIEQDMIQVLNNFKDIYTLCEDKKLIEFYEFNLEKYNEHQQAEKSTKELKETPKVEQEVQEGRVLVEILESDLIKTELLLVKNGIWFEVKK